MACLILSFSLSPCWSFVAGTNEPCLPNSELAQSRPAFFCGRCGRARLGTGTPARAVLDLLSRCILSTSTSSPKSKSSWERYAYSFTHSLTLMPALPVTAKAGYCGLRVRLLPNGLAYSILVAFMTLITAVAVLKPAMPFRPVHRGCKNSMACEDVRKHLFAQNMSRHEPTTQRVSVVLDRRELSTMRDAQNGPDLSDPSATRVGPTVRSRA